jgi:small subunit ribosomal protein S20
MPKQKSAWKELRKNIKRRQRNMAIKSELKTLGKKLEKLIVSKEKIQAQELYKTISSKLDKAASCEIIHKNMASRKKSRLMKKLVKMDVLKAGAQTDN